MLLWWRWQGDDSLWRDLLQSLLQEGRDSGKSCHGQGWAVLMPQVSASAGGDSLSMRERLEKVVLLCHPPICCCVVSRCTVLQLLGAREVALLSPSSPPVPCRTGYDWSFPIFLCLWVLVAAWWQITPGEGLGTLPFLPWTAEGPGHTSCIAIGKRQGSDKEGGRTSL